MPSTTLFSLILGTLSDPWDCLNPTLPEKSCITEVPILAEKRVRFKMKNSFKVESKIVDQSLIWFPKDFFEFVELSKNDKVVFVAFQGVSHATRSELVKLCDLPPITIYDALMRLHRQAIVVTFFE